MSVHTPDWVKNAVFYQIFPDRFAPARARRTCRASASSRGAARRRTGASRGRPVRHCRSPRLAGTWRQRHLPEPIFVGLNHRYHTFDYMLDGPAAGRQRSPAASSRRGPRQHMYVVLDGASSTTPAGFWAFITSSVRRQFAVISTGSPVRGWPLRPTSTTPTTRTITTPGGIYRRCPSSTSPTRACASICSTWRATGSTSVSMAGGSTCRRIDDADFWRISQDGQEGNPDAYHIVGEIWHEAREWLRRRPLRRRDELCLQPAGAGLLAPRRCVRVQTGQLHWSRSARPTWRPACITCTASTRGKWRRRR